MIRKLLAMLLLGLTVGFTVLPFVPRQRCHACTCAVSRGAAQPVAMDPSCGLANTPCKHPVVVPILTGTQPPLERIQSYLTLSWHPRAGFPPLTETSLLVHVVPAPPPGLQGFDPPLRL